MVNGGRRIGKGRRGEDRLIFSTHRLEGGRRRGAIDQRLVGARREAIGAWSKLRSNKMGEGETPTRVGGKSLVRSLTAGEKKGREIGRGREIDRGHATLWKHAAE